MIEKKLIVVPSVCVNRKIALSIGDIIDGAITVHLEVTARHRLDDGHEFDIKLTEESRKVMVGDSINVILGGEIHEG